MTELNLKPCPFCTCRAVELETVYDGNHNLICAHVECPACLARGPQEVLIQNAVQFWNECEPVVETGEAGTDEPDPSRASHYS